MEDQRVPNLEEMDEEQARQFLTGLYSRLSPEEKYEVRHEDYVMDMPQSGERFRGRENMRAFQRAHPALVSAGAPSAGQGGTVGRRGAIDYGDGRVFAVVVISELRDGKMWRDRWYFAEPFEAPEWRSQWVERMEP